MQNTVKALIDEEQDATSTANRPWGGSWIVEFATDKFEALEPFINGRFSGVQVLAGVRQAPLGWGQVQLP